MTVHECPAASTGLMPCCGRSPSEVPPGDMTAGDLAFVTCGTETPETIPATAGEE